MDEKTFIKSCPDFYDIIGSDTLMFRLSNDKFVCINKNEPVDNYKQQLHLSKEIVDYIKKYKSVQIWSVDHFVNQQKIFSKKSRLFDATKSVSEDVCDKLSMTGGRNAFLYKNKGIVVKADDEVDKDTGELAIDREALIYTNLINPTVYSNISEHFVLLVGKSSCGDKKWISLELEGINLHDYLKKNKISNKEYISLIEQTLMAYTYLLHKGLTHNDLKPQNVLVTLTDKRVLKYPSIKIDTYGKIIKIIDFGNTVKVNKRKTFGDLKRFFGLLGDVEIITPEHDKILSKINTFLADNIYDNDLSAEKSLDKLISFIHSL